MRLHLVRHGPTHAKSMVGWTDLPADLSDHAAIARLSAHLPPRAALISSDLSRAVATADAVAAPGRLRLPHDRDWRELHFGAWEMRAFAEVEAEDPDRIRAFWETPGEVRPPNGESWNEVLARINAAIGRLDGPNSAGPDVIVVCHFGAIIAAMQLCLGLSAEQAFSHRIDNLSVTELRRTRSGWVEGRVNHRP